MAVTAKTYKLPPTPLIPNSPYPLIHYEKLLEDLVKKPSFKPTDIFDLFKSNGWQSQWVARYGPDIQSHYHSTTHEAMVVISGEGATIRFGVADEPNWEDGKFEYGARAGGEKGGIELQASLGDVFIIPAGVSHKTFRPQPSTQKLKFFQPQAQGTDFDKNNNPEIEEDGSPHTSEESELARRQFFEKVPVEGEFMMMGCYPYGGVWDFAVGGEHKGHEEDVWYVEKPEKDPVLGKSEEGIQGLWQTVAT